MKGQAVNTNASSANEPSLETRLLRYMEEITPPSTIELTPSTHVFSTGLFDSLALVKLVLWAEEEIGRPLDPRTFDIRREWTRVADIVRFVERERVAAGGDARESTHRR